MKNIRAKRNELVVKSNNLIRDVRYELSEREQKIIIYLISLITLNDTEFKSVQMSIKEYCEVSGIKYNGKNYKDIKRTIKELADKSWWVKSDKSENLFRWIDTVEIFHSGDTITIQFSESLKPYLLQLKSDFTKYELINILPLRGKYAVRIYEILKSFLWIGKFEIGLSEFKELINCNKYNAFKEFNRNVLNRSINEINEYTDLIVKYSTIRKNRKVEELKFIINEKEGYQINMDLILKRIQRLGNE